MVDKNLFLYDLAVVSIMKNEEPYVKEWLDYHLLAGVDHFYIYDNDSTPEFKKILQPYIDAGIVTYSSYPGKARQLEAYFDAVQLYRFSCRYMSWIDADEFIFPKSKPTIVEVVDEILQDKPRVGGLSVNLNAYGSNNLEKADYNVGVLERFTRRAENNWTPPHEEIESIKKAGNAHVSTIANPRRVNFFPTPHAPVYVDTCHAVNENGDIVKGYLNFPVTTEKIVMNHYHTKSYEEYEKKVMRGNADHVENHYKLARFSYSDRNEVFDDSILNYRNTRQAELMPDGDIEELFKQKRIDYFGLVRMLMKNLSPIAKGTATEQFLEGNLDNFLTCLNLSLFLRETFFDENQAKRFEELSLNAIEMALFQEQGIANIKLLLDEMPKILTLPYAIVEIIRKSLLKIIPDIMISYRLNNIWSGFSKLEYQWKMLKTFNAYVKNLR